MWIIASVPLWFIGTLLFVIGVFAIGKVCFNESEVQTFKTAPDIQVLKMAFCMILASSSLLYLAAKIAS